MAKLKGVGGLVSALTMGEISAIAVRYFKTPLKTGPKASAVKQLESLIAAQPSVLAAAAPAAAPAAAKRTRRNYSVGENKRKLVEAVAEFQAGPIDPFTEKKMSLNMFAARVNIPKSVLYKHLKQLPLSSRP